MRADDSMRAHDVRPYEVLRHGAYVCLSVPAKRRSDVAAQEVPALAERLGLRSEFTPGAGEPAASIAYVRRVGATPGHLEDDDLLNAEALVHISATTSEPVATFCEELARLLGPEVRTSVRAGVLRPAIYTGNLMHNLAYAHRVLPQSGTLMPNAFLLPTSKTAEWWRKGWMERHTYFLPRFDGAGNQLAQGHALAASPGVEALMRRTYKHPEEPAPEGSYDFLNYFECTDEDLPTFHRVCAALRDVTQNPEWAFVREGPTWQGRRVESWGELFA